MKYGARRLGQFERTLYDLSTFSEKMKVSKYVGSNKLSVYGSLDEWWENAAIVGNLITGDQKDQASHHRQCVVLGTNWTSIG